MNLLQLENEIAKTRQKLFELGDMRPGSLSKQMRKTKEKYGAYWHLSYTHLGKGRTEYIKEENLKQLKVEVANYKKYRTLFEKLIELSIKKSKLKMELNNSK